MTLNFNHQCQYHIFFLPVNNAGIHVKFNSLQLIVCEISQFKLRKLKFLNFYKITLPFLKIIHLVNGNMLNIHVEFHLPNNCQNLVIAPENFIAVKKRTISKLRVELDLRQMMLRYSHVL